MNDSKNPPFLQGATNLQTAANMAAVAIGPSPSPAAPARGTLSVAANACQAAAKTPAAQTCRQRLKLTFYFDGTGNNRDADVLTYEHSNVARMFLAAPADSSKDGIYSFYIPGLGTYFKDIGDPGETLGKASGRRGEQRLQWALNKLQERRAAATNLVAIDIAVFGFSRGAALARAFANRVQALCAASSKVQGWVLKGTNVAVDIYFLGLWDTVASVGLPKSANNQSKLGLAVSTAFEARPSRRMAERSVLKIAYGDPGADPAPSHLWSWADGHLDWGREMSIPALVSRGVHMMAGHEIRNSFPVDSVMQGRSRATAFRSEEYVYPGAHSDVGGGYRPGEGGRSLKPGQQLSLITLRVMYDKARAAGVPLNELLNEKLVDDRVRMDFAIAVSSDPEPNHEAAREYSEMVHLWNRYLDYCGRGERPMGQWFLAHTKAFYAWRFWNIRKNRVARDTNQLTDDERAAKPLEQQSIQDEVELNHQIEAEEKSPAVRQARQNTASARSRLQTEQQRLMVLGQSPTGWMAPMTLQQANDFVSTRRATITAQQANVNKALSELAAAEQLQAQAEDPLRRLEARKATLPSQGTLGRNWRDYDDRLYADAQLLSSTKTLRTKLRPHYRALVDAWEDEFVNNRGLINADVMKFFERYVHDSLADFAQDATLPSDPRVVYIGGDEIELYAARPEAEHTAQAA